MTKEEILERMIANEITGEEANLILYNSFLLISWIEAIAIETDPLFHTRINPFINSFMKVNPKATAGLIITDLMAKEGILSLRESSKEEKAKKNNIIDFPPWGIKMRD